MWIEHSQPSERNEIMAKKPIKKEPVNAPAAPKAAEPVVFTPKAAPVGDKIVNVNGCLYILKNGVVMKGDMVVDNPDTIAAVKAAK